MKLVAAMLCAATVLGGVGAVAVKPLAAAEPAASGPAVTIPDGSP